MIVIDKRTRKYSYDREAELVINLDSFTLKVWCTPLTFLNEKFSRQIVEKHFDGTLDSIVPYAGGGGTFILEKDSEVYEFSADYFCHSRIYYSEHNTNIYLSDDWQKLPHSTKDFDPFQLLYFLNWDHCFNGNTYFKDIKYLQSTFKYKIESNSLKKYFMPFHKINNDDNIFNALKLTLKAIKESVDTPFGLMLSSGYDSSLISYAGKLTGIKAFHICADIKSESMFDNIQDKLGAELLAKDWGLDLKFADIYLDSFLDGWHNNLLKEVAFSYKDGRLLQGIATEAKRNNLKTIVTGQNSDALYNYSYTGDSENDKLFRAVMTDEELNGLLNGNPSKKLIDFYDCKNKDTVFSLIRFLALSIVKGNGYPKYNGIIVDNACNKKGKRLYDENLEKQFSIFLNLYKDKKIDSARELMLVFKLVGYCDGEDTRSIVGACKANSVRSYQIYSSPLVYNAFLNKVIDVKDVEIGKHDIYEFLNKNIEFVRAQKVKENVSVERTLTASQMWFKVYDILNANYNFDNYRKNILEKLYATGLFDIDKLESVSNKDIGVKMRLSWIGLINDIYEKTTTLQ